MRFDVCGGGVEVSLKDISILKRLNLRRGEAVRLICRHLGQIGEFDFFDLDLKVAIFSRSYSERTARQVVIEKLDRRLDEILNRPLPPKRLQSLLGISSQERLRWTKDGRLPRSGVIQFRRGGVISLSTYPVDQILELIEAPCRIEKWRQEDRIKGFTAPDRQKMSRRDEAGVAEERC